MMSTDLADENDIVMIDKTQDTEILKKNFNFKRKLIAAVRKNPALYDNNHKYFTNVARKELMWQQIAKHLQADVDVCKNTWIQLRFGYQCHARRLHRFFLNGQKKNHRRPAMGLEFELMFLWRFIENRKASSLPFDISEIINEPKPEVESTSNVELEIVEDTNKDKNANVSKETDDDLIIVEQPVELIVIDEDDDSGKCDKKFKVSSGMKKLIEQVKTHPELYDSDHVGYKDYAGRSFIWNGIASKLQDKATKLMKCWIVLQTRYEWELMQNNENTENAPSELQKDLEFLKIYILKNPNTVYKQSYYLRTAWYEPIDYFKDIYNLIVRMKKSPEIVHVTDSLLKSTEKTKQYLSLWSEIASLKAGSTAGQCETTWLIMRYFYCELMSMRRYKYQLTDKWYFESIITELYSIAKAAHMAKQHELLMAKQSKTKKSTKQRCYAIPANHIVKSTTTTTTATTAKNCTTINNNPQTSPAVSKTSSTTTAASSASQVPSLTLPKITGAISLAPQALQANTLLIKQIAGLNNATIQQQKSLGSEKQAVNGTVTTMSTAPTITTTPAQQRIQTLPTIQMPVASLSVQQQIQTPPPLQMPVASASATTAVQQQIQTPSSVQMSAASAIVTTAVQQQTQTPPPVQMPFNLPSQIQLTSVPMSSTGIPPITPFAATSQSVVSGSATSSNLFSIQSPNNSVRQVVPQINVVHNLPTATISSNTNPIMNASAQQPYLASNNASLTVPQTSQPISSLKLKTSFLPSSNTISTNQFTPAVNSNPLIVSTPMTSTISSTTLATTGSQLPKISSAVSLLNPNEILIELIASQNGNHLVVHGPPLTIKYQLTMPTVAKFIREILGIPLLHNKRHNQPTVVNNYWEYISRKFNLPVHICRACWNFLLENFNHFPQIAPLKELMRPFPNTFSVWMESTTLFKKFDEHCVSMGWLQYMDCLPEVIECIGNYPMLYLDIAKKDENSNKQSDMEALCAWRTISLRFPKITPLKEIWKSIKNCFCQYMSDLEFSIENKWPLNWWRALARLKFLVEAKYTTSEPFYYIVSNKMVEEIERCAMLEMKTRYTKDEKSDENAVDEIKIEVGEKQSMILTPIDNCKKVGKDVELGTLLMAMQKQPSIFDKADSVAKYDAWQSVARELNMSVIDCLIAFKSATHNYFAFKKQDISNHCRLNEKYYKKLDRIVRSIQSNKASTSRIKLNIKTPFELNQSIDLSPDYVFPERFISDINMTNCPSTLVVKNWIYGFSLINKNFLSNNATKEKLVKILSKQLKNIYFIET